MPVHSKILIYTFTFSDSNLYCIKIAYSCLQKGQHVLFELNNYYTHSFCYSKLVRIMIQ